MSKVRITKEFRFEAGHALHGYDGKCKNIHGHSYRLLVTIIGEPISDSSNVKFGMVLDFGDLKKIVNEKIINVFDHATVLNVNSPHSELATYLEKKGHHILKVDYQPTSEMMISDFADKIKSELPEKVNLYSLRLYETATSYTEWFASDN